MDLEWSWWRFLWGIGGALSPEAIRLYRIVTDPARGTGAFRHLDRSYFLISLVFFAVGGALSVAWGDNNPLKCFWVGVSVPVIVSSFANQIPSRTDIVPAPLPQPAAENPPEPPQENGEQA